ncbi:MAG: PAS domain S-box protein [Armatimonadetes bacterium]|nr:PAS domain S-box protein [Armatimonadota bacterium]
MKTLRDWVLSNEQAFFSVPRPLVFWSLLVLFVLLSAGLSFAELAFSHQVRFGLFIVIPVIVLAGMLRFRALLFYPAFTAGQHIMEALLGVQLGQLLLNDLVSIFTWSVAGIMVVLLLNSYERVRQINREERKSSQFLAEKTGLLETILNSVPVGVYVVDGEGKVMTWNRAAERLFGYGRDEVVGKYFCCTPGSKEVKWCENGCAIKNGNLKQVLFRVINNSTFLLTREDRLVPVEVASETIFDHSGRPLGILEVFRDTSREQEAQQLKDGFLATVSHDLKTPLAAIMGYVNFLLSPAMSEGTLASARRDLEGILSAAKVLSLLTNAIVENRRMEEASVLSLVADFAAGPLVSEVAEMLDPLAKAKGVRIHSQVPDHLSVSGDREAVRRVFINLLSNGIRFSLTRGEIFVRGKELDSGLTEFQVEDQGTGISPEDCAYIFEKYSRAAAHKGTGLGLFIARKIIEAHAGTIEVSSRPGEGTVFRFTLPSTRDSSREPAVTEPRDPGTQDQYTRTGAAQDD